MRFRYFVLLLIVAGTINACSLSDLLEGNDPPDGTVVDPNTLKTYQGALGQYYAAIHSMSMAISRASEEIGLFTDELTIVFGEGGDLSVDGRTANARSISEGVVASSYTFLQATRVRAGQASELLLQYGTEASYPLIGHAYALQAQSILMMAEMLCSGIPLTEAPFEGGVKFTPPLSTSALLERAVALFDTAYSYGKDSLPIATLARVGKGRALLSLGKYAEAAQAVADVPTDAQYTITFSSNSQGVPFMNVITRPYQVLDREGNTGIKWTADSARFQDPRLPLSTLPDSSGYTEILRQRKYVNVAPTVIIADGIQARMIEAEAQLQPANAPRGLWLTTLNAARATRGLTSLSDPGTASARIDMLFRERALWTYLSGQRLGDMRRLVRIYGRRPEQVYAVGTYPFFNTTVITYGNEYVFVPTDDERQFNPLYKGCLNKEP